MFVDVYFVEILGFWIFIVRGFVGYDFEGFGGEMDGVFGFEVFGFGLYLGVLLEIVM